MVVKRLQMLRASSGTVPFGFCASRSTKYSVTAAADWWPEYCEQAGLRDLCQGQDRLSTL